METSYTDYLKQKFIETGEVNKENFEDLFPEWRYQLEDEEMDKFAIDWANIRIGAEFNKIMSS